MTKSISAKAIYNAWNLAAKKFPDKVKVYNDKGILAYNTPADDPYLNWVWASEVTPNLVNKIERFFKGKPHCWFVNKDDQVMVGNAVRSGLLETYSLHEYILELNNYSIKQEEVNEFKIKALKDHEDLKIWSRVFSEAYDIHTPEYIYNYKKYLLDASNPYTILGYLNAKPVATGQLFISGEYASIVAISTLKEARNKGYARMVNYHLINFAKEKGCSKVSLNSLPETQEFYTKLGFKAYSKDYGYIDIKYLM